MGNAAIEVHEDARGLRRADSLAEPDHVAAAPVVERALGEARLPCRAIRFSEDIRPTLECEDRSQAPIRYPSELQMKLLENHRYEMNAARIKIGRSINDGVPEPRPTLTVEIYHRIY
jgi:hypothetical protein